VRHLTAGVGVTAALDAVGGAAGAELSRCVRPNGTMLYYGLLSGQPLPPDVGASARITVRGFWLREWVYRASAARWAAAFATVLGHVAAGRIVLPVAARYALGEVATAVRAAERPGRHGKVIPSG
jgi:NADPH:quinone reductase-like Zn-dependent oxidoreductase